MRQGVSCTLEELSVGCTKQEKYRSQRYSIEIPPGTQDGKTFSFKEDGIQFVIKEQPHARFKKTGDDLRHTAVVDLWSFVFGFSYCFRQLDGRKRELKFRALALMPIAVKGAGFTSKGMCYVRASPIDPVQLDRVMKICRLIWWAFLICICLRNPALLFFFMVIRQIIPFSF